MSKCVDIYTDGACSQQNNSGRGPGGWGVIVLYPDGARMETSGGEDDTTNQRMELMAAIKAMELLKEAHEVRLHTDSAYVSNCFKERWYVAWRRNGWMTSKDRPVVNADLWRRLIELVEKHDVTFVKVKGHASSTDRHAVHNNRCDELARAAITRADFQTLG